MTKKKDQDEINQLRSKAQGRQMEDAPMLESTDKNKNIIKRKRSPWILRTLILVLATLLVVEIFVIGKYRKEANQIVVEDRVVMLSSPIPEISAPFPAPSIEVPDDEVYEPEPTPIPLPPELVGIEFPTEGGE